MARSLVWVLGGGTAVAAGAVTLWIAVGLREGEAPQPAPPVGSPAAAPAESAPEPVVAEAPAIVPPRFDVVRVARDGETLVAGSAAPGAAITLRVDGVTVAEAAADGAGQFVALFSLGASEAPQVMTLEMQDAEGRVTEAEETVILTPRPAQVAALAVPEAPASPEPVASVAPEPAASPDAPASVPPEPVETAAADVPPADTTPEVAPVDVAAAAPAALPAAPATVEVASMAPAVEMPSAFLVRRDGGVEVLDRAPSGVDNVVIDSIAYSDTGTVQIAGRAARTPPEASLRIYLDNRAIAEAQSEGGDWRLDLPSIDPGVHTLRVDQLGPDGRVESRFETPFLRESPEAIAAARARAGVTSTPPAAPAVLAEVEASAPTAPTAEGVASVPAAPARAEQVASTAPAAPAPVAEVVAIAPAAPGAPSPEAEVAVTAPMASAPVAEEDATAPSATVPTAEVVASAPAIPGPTTEVVASVPVASAPAPVAEVVASVPAAPASTTEVVTSDPAAQTPAREVVANTPATSAPAPVAADVATAPTAPATATEVVASAPAAATPAAEVAATAPAAPTPATEVAATAPAAPTPTPRVSLITVQPGHTLWHISRERYGAGEQYVIIYRANRSQIRDPDLIYPGQIFTLPEQ